MNLVELQSVLYDLGADIPQNTLKRWGYDGLIRRPQRYKKGKGGGKGRAVSWTWDAVAEAAAIWAIKNAGILKAPPSKKMIDAIKLTEYAVYQWPPAKYSPPPPGTKITAESVRVKFVDDERQDLDSYPGRTPAERSDLLNSLVVVWICAIEKARRGMSLQKPARVVLHSIESNATELERLEEPYILKDITVEAADRDEVIERINGLDMRELAARLFISGASSTRAEKKSNS